MIIEGLLVGSAAAAAFAFGLPQKLYKRYEDQVSDFGYSMKKTYHRTKSMLGSANPVEELRFQHYSASRASDKMDESVRRLQAIKFDIEEDLKGISYFADNGSEEAKGLIEQQKNKLEDINSQIAYAKEMKEHYEAVQYQVAEELEMAEVSSSLAKSKAFDKPNTLSESASRNVIKARSRMIESIGDINDVEREK